MGNGYLTSNGYMGYVPWEGRYLLFATYEEYIEYITEEEDDEKHVR